MKADPIVEEIHRVRKRMLDECGGDLEKYFDRIEADEALDRARLVSKIGRGRRRAPAHA